MRSRLLQLVMSVLLLGLFSGMAVQEAAAVGTPELSGSWGWMWGGSASSRVGTFRLNSAATYSGALSIPVGALNWTEAHYTYQGSSMTLDGSGLFRPLTDIGIHYMQLAGLRGLRQGPVMPYVLGGIGTTYYSPSESFVDINGTIYNLDSSWKLSFVLGAGLKVWLGEAEKVGLRLQFRALPTLFNSSTGIWVGGGGGGVSVSGNAVWQFDVSAGVAIKLGG